MKSTTSFLIKSSIKNCGIATALINGIISYFTFVKGTSIMSSVASTNFMTVSLGCALLCPLFGGLILKGLNKNELMNLAGKHTHTVAKFMPMALLPGVLVIAVFTFLSLWVLPYAIVTLLNIEFAMTRIAWVMLLTIYSGVVATSAAYFGIIRAYYAMAK